jgi:hypothetical protein
MAIKRLEETKLSRRNRKCADNLIRWFKNHRDDVTQGAWYPDEVIKDMANSHVLKHTPSDAAKNKFKKLPNTYLNYEIGERSPLRKKSFTVEKGDNLPDRCEAIAHSVIDDLKIQESEEKGSPVSPVDNHIALLLFMLSHYIADAHVPLHCDNRKFSKGKDIHGHIEGQWDKTIKKYYPIDSDNERFFYDADGYPRRDSKKEQAYKSSFLKAVDDELKQREFLVTWGSGNSNVWDFMTAICQYSYLLSYEFIPEKHDHKSVTKQNWRSLGKIKFDELSVAVFSDAIDSIARVWLRVWRKYLEWEKKQRAKTR